MGAIAIVFSVVSRLLAAGSAVLGFMAEGKTLTPSDIYYDYQGACVYPASPAFTLGISAMLLLLVAIFVSLADCCSGKRGASGSRRIWGHACYALSWVAAMIAVGLYVQGAAWNADTTRDPETSGMPVVVVQCRYLQGPVFTVAASLSVAATALGIFSFVILRAQQAPAAATPSSSSMTTAPAAPPASAGTPAAGPKTGGVVPPAGEAVVVPVDDGRYGQA